MEKEEATRKALGENDRGPRDSAKAKVKAKARVKDTARTKRFLLITFGRLRIGEERIGAMTIGRTRVSDLLEPLPTR